MTDTTPPNDELIRRANAAGIMTSYYANDGSERHASADTLTRILEALGGDHDDPLAVVVAWDGHLPELPDGSAIILESGVVNTDDPLPLGYHALVVDDQVRGTVIAAPRLAPAARPGQWGVLMPLYALRIDDDSPLATYPDLGRLFRWLDARQGDIVLTLPLLPTFLDQPGADWSPYSPVSRRMWSELYVDLDHFDLPRADAPPTGEYLDYPAIYARRIERLDRVAEQLWPTPQVQQWAADHPLVTRYASFRGAQAVHGRNWRAWPTPQGELPEQLDHTVERRHIVAAYLADQQLAAVVSDADASGQSLALDIAIGTHSDGFDVWDLGDLFVNGMSVGAPPDPVFVGGQDWGFPPVHPARSRTTAHRYFRDTIRHHLTHASVLRLDHVMGLMRQWWVPHGNRPTDGAYVRYPLHELLAVVCLEAALAGAVIAGENLGLVPPEINAALDEHQLMGIFVHQDIIPTYGRDDRQRPKRSDMAMLTTHDGVPFAGYWDAADIKRQFKHDLIDADQLARGEAERIEAQHRFIFALRDTGLLRGDAWVDDLPEILRAAAVELAGQDADIVIYPLEDLWLETRPQNTPGTFQEEPNWRRTATVTLTELTHDQFANETLAAIAEARAAVAERNA